MTRFSIPGIRLLRIAVFCIFTLAFFSLAFAQSGGSLPLPLKSTSPAPSSPEPTGSGQGESKAGGLSFNDFGFGDGITQEDCTKASKNYLIFVLILDLLAVGLATLIIFILSGRGIWTHSIRFLVPAIFTSIIAAVIIGWNPFATDVYFHCIENMGLQEFIHLGSLNTWIRGIILGFVPTFIVFTLVIIILKKLGKF